jgi:hypothetical protein
VQRAKKALEDLSRTDPLTGLPNRRALMEAGEVPAPQTMVLVISPSATRRASAARGWNGIVPARRLPAGIDHAHDAGGREFKPHLALDCSRARSPSNRPGQGNSSAVSPS